MRRVSNGGIWSDTKRVVAYAACLLLAVSPRAAAGQSPDSPLRVWLGLGLAGSGASGLDVNGGATGHLTAEWGVHHVSLRVTSLSDWASLPDGGDDSAGDVALLYGRARYFGAGYLAAAAGPAAVSVKGCMDCGGDTRRTAGLTLTAQAGLQATIVGLSLQGFTNLNTISIYGGVALVVELGWM